MKKQAAFVLLSLLYLASTLATIQAVKYTGPEEVREGQSWVIECTGLKPSEKIQWTKDDQPIPGLATGKMSVNNYEGGSKLVSYVSFEHQSGSYKCTPDNNATFTLSIKSGSTIKVFAKSDETMNLTCDGYSSGDHVEWKKDDLSIDKVLESIKDVKNQAEYIKEGENGMLMLKYHERVLGKYKCNTTSNSNNATEIKLVKPPIINVMENKSVVEGEVLEFVCTFAQVEPEDVKIIWEFNGTEYAASTDRIVIEDSNTTDGKRITRAKFTLKRVQMSDRDFPVTCKAAYNWPDTEDHISFAKVHFRVKDKLAALWPFLGICAEVVVLCAIILIYEKKRNKAELEESDTDQSPDTKPTPNKDSDVRQRK